MKNLLFVLLLYSFSSYAQDKTDSIQTKKSQERRVQFHLDRAFDSPNANSTKYHAERSLHFANLSNNDTLLMKSYHAMAHASKKKHDYNLTKENTYKCLDIAKKLNDSYFLFLCNNLLGIVKASEKQYQLSTEYYSNALTITKKTHDTLNESLLYHNIAINYYLIDKFELAKMFMQKSEDTYKSIKVFKDPFRKNFDYIILYMKKSIVTDSKKNALLYANQAINRASQSDYTDYLPLTHKYKGRVYLKYNDYELALENFQKALTYEASNKSSDSYLELINVLVKSKQYDAAKQYVDTLFQTFALTDIRSIYLDKNKVLAEVYQNVGDSTRALIYTQKRAIIADSLLKYNNYELFAEYGKKFETKEKEKEIIKQHLVIERQDGEKKNMLLLGGVTLFVGLLLFQWKFNIQKNSKKDVEDAYEKERDFNHMRTAFLENISHEIRTPLTLINGYLNLIDEETNSNPKINGYVKNALSNSKKVIFDADEILNLLKFEDHKMLKKIVSRPLNEFLKGIFLSFEVLSKTRNLELIYASKISDTYKVEIDVEKVDKIITNLISNAIKFSDSNSKVIFDATIYNNSLIVKVTDFGQGVSVEDQKRIFTRFYQSKNNKSIGGIGIGLLLAKDFAQFLDGNVTVESKIGQGSTFIFTMPVSESVTIDSSTISSAETKTQPKIVSEINDKPSILIVEDNIEMSNYLKEILNPFYNCTFAFNGFEGLDFAKNQQFDLIASDIMMPKLDGYQFREKLKLIPQYTKIPFILITAKSLPEDKVKGFSIGIDDYITKPFQKEELIVRIDNLLKNSNNLKLCFADSENSTGTHTDKLVDDVTQVILENLANENFKVENLASEMNYSQRQLSRILNKHTGLTTIKFILEIKLSEAYKMIASKKYKTISEIQYNVGISSPSYFSDKFKNRFGITPSELMKK